MKKFAHTTKWISTAAACWVLSIGPASAQSVNCEAALQFDTQVVEQNVFAKLSILNVVTSANYEESKKNYGAKIPGYFSGNFDEFQKKRSDLSQSFSLDKSMVSQTNFFQRVLSPAGAQAFAECVARIQNEEILAWISTGQRSEFVAVTVKRNGAGTTVIDLDVIVPPDVQLLNKPKPLAPGSSQSLLFRSLPSKPFFALINASNPSTGAIYAAKTIEMPPYIEYRLEQTTTTLTGSAVCGAGCQGNTTGCQMSQTANFSAPSGYFLLPDTLTLTGRQTIGGPGLVRDPAFSWMRSPSESSRPLSMTGQPGVCEGQSPHTQGITRFDFSIQAAREKIVKVTQ